MRLQYFGSSTQERQFAAMLSDRALGIKQVAILFPTYSNFDVIYKRFSEKSHH